MKPILSAEIQNLAEDYARLGKVFSNPQRILILWFLADKEKTVSEIAEAIRASKPRTSQHLLLMRRNNILESRRERKHIYYRIADNELLQSWPAFVDRPENEWIKISSFA